MGTSTQLYGKRTGITLCVLEVQTQHQYNILIELYISFVQALWIHQSQAGP